MNKQWSAGIVGVSGYSGMELARLLARHPAFRLVSAVSDKWAGRTLGEAHVNIAQSGTQVNFSTTSVTLTHNTKNMGTLYFVNQTQTAQIVAWSGGTSTIQSGQRARVSLKIGTTTSRACNCNPGASGRGTNLICRARRWLASLP